MKSNLLKSIFISLILVMGVANMSAATITSDGTARLYFNMKAVSWWIVSSNDGANYAYFFNSSTNAWSTKATQYSGDTYYVTIPKGSWTTVILTRNSKSGPGWNEKLYNQTGNITLSSSSNYISKFSEGSTSATWGTAVKPASTGSLSASSTSVNTGESVTLTPSLTSNQTINDIKSTAYSISPNSGASISGNTFTATKAGTYTVTATITYNPDGYTSLTSTVSPTVTITVTIPTHTVSYGVCSTTRWGSIQLNSETAITTTGTKTLNYGTSISFTATPNPGYQVEGWYSDSGCTSKITAAGTSETYNAGTLTANKTVYVKFEAIPANSHNITYTEEGTGWTYGAKTTSAEEGAQVTFVVNPTTGYRVSVSSDGPALTGPNANNQYTFTMPNKDVKITVEAKPEQYNVTLNKQSGTGGASSVTATYLVAMPSITPPTRTGYTFNGYFDAASDGTKYYNADGSSAKNWDKTEATPLYAQWTANKYTVTFNANDGTGTMSNQSFEYDETKPLTANAFTRKGYEFTGWNTQANGLGDSYSDKESVSNLSATDGATVTLYAQWNQLSPTTVYINPKTKWEETLKIICDGEDANMTPVGCDGYYTAEVPGGTTELKFGGNNETTLSLTIPQDDKVLYDMTSTNITKLYLKPNANWKSDGARFAAYFFGNGDKWVSMTAVNGETDLYEVTIPTEKSYPKVIFVRMNGANQTNNWDNDWNQTGDLTVPEDGTNQYTIDDGSWNAGSWHKVWDNSCWTTYEPSNTYTISFVRQGATTGSESVTATFGEKPATIDIPEREGYTFNGYYTTASEGTQIIDAEGKWINGTNYVDADGNWISTDCNITFYAQWTEKLSRITIIVSEGGSVKVDGEDFVSGNTVKVGVATSKTITLHPNAGYGIAAFGVDGDAWIAGNGTYTLTAKGSGSTGTLYANFVALEYTITWNPNGGKVDPTTSSYTYNGTTVELPTPTRDGFTFVGWFTEQSGGTQITEIGTTNKPTSDVTYYAQWTANTYTVVLNQEGAASIGTEEVTATYDADMPSIPKLPTAKDGYAFMGYWDEENGQGTQYYNQEGTAFNNKKWDKTENDTLYAYFKAAEISIELNAASFEPNSATPVIATATLTPTPAGTTSICWSLLYSGSENEVAEHDPQPTGEPNQVQFNINDLANGTYQIKATLREGTGCTGTIISHATQVFTITSEHTITIKYVDENGQTIKASTTQSAHVSSLTEITAPEITGYNFKEWEAGDGVSIKGATDGKKNTAIIEFTAYYDGYLTAKYTKDNNIIYFYNTLGWENVYVYFYNSDSWNNTDGTGSRADKGCTGHAKMTRMGESNIWYTDAQGKDTKFIVFNQWEQNNYEWFSATSVVRRGDYNSVLPMFVPIADQTPSELHEYTNNNQTYVTKYYNKGYWMNYPDNSGYKLHIYDDYGDDYAVKDITYPFGENTIFPLQIKVELNAENIRDGAHKMWFRVQRNDNRNFGGDQQKLPAINSTKKNGFLTDVTDSDYKIQFITPIAGTYTFTLDYKYDSNAKDYQYHIDVQLPAEKGDYRILYRDVAEKTWSGNTKTNNWCHPSRVIKKGTDTKDIISFFINKDVSSELYYQTVASIDDNTGNITWDNNVVRFTNIDWSQIDTSGVYNFVFVQDGKGISLENTIEPYTGNYYIRCDAVGGKWDNYKTDKENRMTYSAFSESKANSFGDKYSHYVTKFCEKGTNIKFTIANDYSPCITDTLTKDILVNGNNPFDNLDDNGTIKNEDKYKANVRFMWNRTTNRISRAYIGPAGDEVADRQFLILKADKEIKNASGGTLSNAGDNHNAHQAIFSDTQNWIYERTIQVKPKTRVKLYACYPEVDPVKAQYFCGTYNNNAFNDDEDSKLALGGSADDQNYYSIRVLYDFKTNRLLMAWMPSGDTENVNGTKNISADVMLIRDHHNPAQCITFADERSNLSDVKTVYGTMRFNRWVLNNRGGQDNLDVKSCGGADSYDENTTNSNHPVLQPAEQKSQYERALYFISFPFDVNVSDIFGFGTYGQHWIIEYYDGLKRAREGYWIDSDPNWKYVTNPDEFVLEKYKGYILCLNLSKMAYNNTDFWAHNISQVELFFPSTTTMSEIKRTEVTMPELGEEYLCKINRNTPEGDRRVKDSYWRCIGVPSYANYSNVLKDEEGKPIQWQTSYTTFPFLYAWNMTDNTLTPQSTKNFNFKTMHAYLVQNGGKIHWSAVSATPKPSNIVARRQAPSEINNYEWKLTLSRNEQIEDQTFVRLSDNEQITTEFDFNQDLSKEFNYGRSDIYTLIGYEKAAANSLPITETTTLIPLGLSIEYNGDYTIAMPDRMENIGVTLIDTESNTRTNLSAGMEYTLTLNKGDYNNRFFIEISPAHQVPTDIEYVTGDSNSQDNIRKVLIDNILYIVRDGQIFDARGARLK